MTGWLLVAVPLLLAPLVLLLAHAGCTFEAHAALPTDPYGDTVKAEPGLVGYWRLDETSGTMATDSSTSGLTGQYSADVTLGVPGALDGPSYATDPMDQTHVAVELASGAFVEVSSDARLQPPFAFSLEVWAQFQANADTLTLMGSLLPGGAGYAVGADGPANKLTINGLVRAADGTKLTVAAAPIDGTDGAWHHVVMTYDAGTSDTEQLALYVDGVRSSSESGTHSYDPPLGRYFRLGFGGDELTPYVGGLDEAAFYNRALDPIAVAQHLTQRSG